MREPLLRSWISASHPPATVYPELPGRWVGDDAWPSPDVVVVPYAFGGEPVLVDSPHHTGMDAGRFFPFGNDADLPPDQREEDAKSACFEFPVATDGSAGRIDVLGRPRVTLRLRMDAAAGQAIARLCDVAPDGSSTLVTRGVLNLSAREGRDRVVPWPEGVSEDVTFELNGIGHSFPPGHRILDPAGTSLELPVRRLTQDSGIAFEPPEQSEPLIVVQPVTLDAERPERLVTRDVAQGTWRLDVDPRYGGTRVYPDGLEFTEEAQETYTIQESDPLSARARSEWTVRLHRPDLGWDAQVETRSETSCDAEDFITSNEVICRDGDEIVFHRTWEKRITRTAG
jgi:hypothetical protein